MFFEKNYRLNFEGDNHLKQRSSNSILQPLVVPELKILARGSIRVDLEKTTSSKILILLFINLTSILIEHIIIK
jgi:hypothetical protein